MFSPGSLEKNCVRPESCSPSRNVSTRFPVGIPLLGDENQQISRIQLAVQKYNNSGPIPVNNKSGFSSPVRHCFLKNSHKSKNYETEEGTTKTEKNSGNYYEGVGSFPTIHLRKSAIRYRPIRRSHDVKVPYPELPVNRYLSHLPELCTDLKSSTRSVLDVLQDLSAKKIHQDEDDGSSKMKSKGLAGDYIMDPNAVYKPLFVQKSKPNSVATRDIMTQTSSPFCSDTPSPQICNLNSRNDVYDPKAELRKKLAKQNNEISASLSSSISASFAIKRKIVTAKDDDQSPDVSSVKKSKIDYTSQTENGFAKSVNSKTEPKPNRKSKLLEATSPSPNKDRLTTIFLDMRNTSPKSEIFQNSSTPKSNGVSNGVESNTPKVNGVSEAPKTPEEPQKPSTQENDKSKPMYNLPVSKADSPKASAPTFQFGLPNNTNFNFKPIVNPEKDSTDASQTSTKDVTDDKKDKQSNTLSFVSSANNFSGFKFGTDVSKSTVEQKTDSSVIPVTTATTVIPQFAFGVKSSDPVVSVSQTSAQDKLSTPGKSLFNFGQNESSSSEAPKTITSPATVAAPSFSQKPGMFTFGQKPLAESSPIQTSAQTNVTTTTPSMTQPPSSESSSLTSTTAPGLFSFGQKAETPTSSAPGQSAADQKPQFMFTFGQKTESPKAPETGQKNLFTFGQKAPETSSSASPSFGQASAQPSVSFGATLNGSKPFGGFVTPTTSSSSSTAPTQSVFGVSTTQSPLTGTTVQSNSVFGISTAATPSFGTLAATTTTTTTTATAAVTTATPTFGVSTITTPVFGVPTTTTPAFGAVTTTTSTLGSSTTGLTFGSPLTTMTATTSVPTVTTTTSAFGLSTPTFKFGAGTTQTTTFGAPTAITTQSTSGFSLNANQTTFTSNPAPVFGATTQSVPAFGISSASPAFGAATSTSVPAFGTSASVSAPMFGSSTSSLTKTTFGTSTTQNAFGASTTQTTPAFGTTSQSIPAFGTSTTQAFGTTAPQSTSFGNSSTATTTPAFGASGFGASFQPKSILGAPATTQSVFGSTTNTFGMSGGFGATSQSNTGFGASNGTQTTSAFETQPFGKSTAPGLFGQSPAPTFSSGTNLTPNQNNIFNAKPNENKPFGAQNNFQFGSTSTSTAFTTSPPSTSAPVFSFGGGASTNTFSFSGTSSAGSNNTQTPFAFTPNEPFKFGASTSKENPGFGATASPNFNFGGNQMNNGPANAAFDFRQTQNSTAPGFNFSAGSSSSPSVFSFGGSGGSSSSSGRGFNFGTPTPGASFGQSTPTFGVPGTFSIGSGSSQSRPRAASRLRRRP